MKESSAVCRAAFRWACLLDVQAPKPGNVSFDSPGHRMQAAQFVTSAQAAAPALCAPAATVGMRIEAALERSWEAVGCNTNLGIVLLCAPLAAAAQTLAVPCTLARLRDRLAGVLSALTVDDARRAYRAIARANPGGLGRVPAQDVAAAPDVDLRAAMRLAADRDRIAYQYAENFCDVVEIGLPEFLRVAPREGADRSDYRNAMLAAYLGFLTRFADSHIVRKFGLNMAQSVTAEARHLVDLTGAAEVVPAADRLIQWDRRLKSAGINPGTSADLCVASAMMAALVDPAAQAAAMRGVARNVVRS